MQDKKKQVDRGEKAARAFLRGSRLFESAYSSKLARVDHACSSLYLRVSDRKNIGSVAEISWLLLALLVLMLLTGCQ